MCKRAVFPALTTVKPVVLTLVNRGLTGGKAMRRSLLWRSNKSLFSIIENLEQKIEKQMTVLQNHKQNVDYITLHKWCMWKCTRAARTIHLSSGSFVWNWGTPERRIPEFSEILDCLLWEWVWSCYSALNLILIVFDLNPWFQVHSVKKL